MKKIVILLAVLIIATITYGEVTAVALSSGVFESNGDFYIPFPDSSTGYYYYIGNCGRSIVDGDFWLNYHSHGYPPIYDSISVYGNFIEPSGNAFYLFASGTYHEWNTGSVVFEVGTIHLHHTRVRERNSPNTTEEITVNQYSNGLKITGDFVDGTCLVNIHNILGEQVLSTSAKSEASIIELPIDTAKWPTGNYFISITDGSKLVSVKFVILR